MAQTVMVTGAAGVLGRAVTDALTARGSVARSFTRAHGDLTSGAGLAQAMRGTDAVIHCASSPLKPQEDPVVIDQLVAAARASGGPRILYVGIAGIERAAESFPYYAAKLECERRLAASGVPHAIVRATQFHPFIDFILSRLNTRFALLTPRGTILQPVGIDFVAERLADHALAGTEGRVPDIHGPEALRFDELGRAWLRARELRRPLLGVPMSVQPFRALRELTPAAGDSGGETWQEWLLHRRPTEYSRARSTSGT